MWLCKIAGRWPFVAKEMKRGIRSIPGFEISNGRWLIGNLNPDTMCIGHRRNDEDRQQDDQGPADHHPFLAFSIKDSVVQTLRTVCTII